jgi:predicted esterase
MNAKIEPLAKEFAPKGWALLVPTAKVWDSWTEADGRRLLGKTLPDVARVEGLDAARPVLFGFSAGGQMALELWADDPARFGGLVLDAAYPLDAKAYADGTVVARPLPAGDAVQKTPLLVVVGDADPGHRLWKSVETPWRDAGVPLRVLYVPGGEHQWLIGTDEGAALLAWLSDIAAGKCPGAPDPLPPVPPPATPSPVPGK